jgi:Holliday junction resolvase
MHPSKTKGNTAEREAARILADQLGYPIVRRHNIGTHDDIGDLIGLPDTVVQVCSLSRDVVAVGVVRKPLEADIQARTAGTTHAVTMLRIRGGTWRMVMTPAAFCTLWREATA